ncbi:hypothetical protein LWC35_12065 [Pseudonocardia kujensis]|uniref:hypothetical protein n=1 Tax=Pseudonocardia kujensis TaxID=1128675 RepID=UPI001E5525F2|nr:hypothetical protein [Pseudonocardia kujensis]MCE0763634.1 hypothetical protein [Pseudonocardia kujensis]
MLQSRRHRAAPPSGPPGCAGGLLLGVPAAVGAQVVAWACDPADVGVGVGVGGLVLAALAAGLVATATSTAGAAVAGAVGWAVYDGFSAHRLGELQTGPADLRALVVVVGAALVFRGLAAVLRAYRTGARPGGVLTVLGHVAHSPLLGPDRSVLPGAGPGARDAPPKEDPCTRCPSSSSTSTPTAPRHSSSTR